jgi:hypothetical protein|tara:strand:- start:149 stop:787 length:639 start_codon:yes stop_codon:yes gene_type:complete
MEYLKYTPEMARDWKNAINASEGYLRKRVADSMNESQLVSKLWLVEELSNLNVKPVNISLLAGWFAQYIVPLLYDNIESVEWIENFEMDRDIKRVAYKFNTRYKKEDKYKVSIRNVMFGNLISLSSPTFDTVINCSCEHMYPMSKFKKLKNTGVDDNALYILQSSNDTQYDDHINCVNDADELADQANLIDILYAGEKLLPNGMTRFMVIGR